MLAHGTYDRLTQMAHEVKAAAAADGEGVPDAASGAGRGSGAAFGPAATAGVGATAGSAFGVAATRVANDTATTSAAAATEGAADAEVAAAAVRSMDELRADILADLLLAGTPEAHDGPTGLGTIHATVEVTVPVLTLLGKDAGPVDLAGHGPIDPDTARRLAGHAHGWDRVMTHPVTGTVLAVDRYRPSEQIRRALRVRDRHCRFPGCRQPAWRCDIDHTKDAAHGGETKTCNLAHLCRRHHILKHHTAWQVRQLADGILEWTSPTGRIYRDIPVSSVAFAPTSNPLPGADLPPGADPPPF